MSDKLLERPMTRRRERRKQAIVQAALDLLVEGDLEGLTLQRLAKELDYTPGALYRYFPSKGALIAELQVTAISEFAGLFTSLRGRLAERLSDAQDEKECALVHILAITRLHGGLASAAPAQFALIRSTLSEPRSLVEDEHTAAPLQAALALVQEVAGAIDGASAVGALTEGDALDRALVLLASTQGILQLEKLRRFDSDRFDTARLAVRLTRDLLVAWGASPTALEAAAQHLESAGDALFDLASERAQGGSP